MAAVSFEGEGCAVGMAATGMLPEGVVRDRLTRDEILDLDHDRSTDALGRTVVGSRATCATLGLGTPRHAVGAYRIGRTREEIAALEGATA